MHPQTHAAQSPDRPAVVMAGSGATLSYADLDAASNRVAHLLRAHGLRRGDTLVIWLDNCIEYFPILWAAQRSGLVFVAMSTRLTAGEAAYIVGDSGAKAIFASARFADLADGLPTLAARFAVGGHIPGWTDFAPAVAAQPAGPIADQSPGRDMLYSSGTTGRPKGVRGALPEGPIDAPDALTMLLQHLYAFAPGMVYLGPAPLYHAAPLRYSMTVHRFGGTVVVMEKFDPEAFLALIGRHAVTHTQLVPTMFVKLLKLPPEARARVDLATLTHAIHAAAPCPVAVKQAMLDWWGDIVFEYYSATEGAGFTAIAPHEWRAHPGSVGRALLGEIRVLGDDDRLLAPGETGRIYFANGPAFAYHGDPAKTASVINAHGATFGDIGHVDADGYLYLTDRASFMIISGGVNVYPQETEDALVMHEAVADVAVFGVPDAELGEAVKAVVELRPGIVGDAALAADLIAFARARLSPIKCPKSVDFIDTLPRHDTGKLYKRLLKDRYWAAAGA